VYSRIQSALELLKERFKDEASGAYPRRLATTEPLLCFQRSFAP
jgi:hypothetical protein